MVRKQFTLTLLIVLMLAACAEPDATPTLEPPPTVTADQATAVPDATETGAPPSATATSPTGDAAAPTATTESETPETGTPTLAATSTPTVEPTVELAALAITEPAEGATWDAGSSVDVSGIAPSDVGAVSVTLSAAGLELATAEGTPSEAGEWQATMEVPSTVTGTAVLRAAVGGTAVEQLVQIERAATTSGSTISLSYPQPTSTVVSGHVLFFTGSVQRPPEETVTIAVLYEDCETVASTTSFEVGEGGQWWGYLVVPETVFGPGCALAYIGGFAETDWHAAHAPITVLEQDDPQARGVYIGNFANSEVTPGESVTVYGSAYNAPNRQVQVSLRIDGTAVAQGTTTTDGFGFWEINLALPADVGANSGEFSATVSYAGEQVRETVPFTIAPLLP